MWLWVRVPQSQLTKFSKMKKGDKVIYLVKLQMLDEGTIGVVSEIYNDWCSIVYPQNSSYDYDDKGNWKPKKNAPNKIYAHSAKLCEVKLVE